MKTEGEIRARAELYREMLCQAMEQRSQSAAAQPELDLLLLNLLDRLEALLWVMDELEDTLLLPQGQVH